MNSETLNLEAALTYISRGFAMLPLKAGAKIPACCHRVNDACKNESQVRDWFTGKLDDGQSSTNPMRRMP